MITLRRSGERGHADLGWLKSRHSFSFADYHDPCRTGFGNLRVINEDLLAPGTGLAVHAHRDVEIVSLVLCGALAQRDSVGSGGAVGSCVKAVLRPGDVQCVSAGRGLQHCEFNPAPDQSTRVLQIWLEPNARGIEPGTELRRFEDAAKCGRWCLVASPDGRDGSLRLHADASIHAGRFGAGQACERDLDPARKAYVHALAGRARVNGVVLGAGDALGLEHESRLAVDDCEQAELLWFELT